MNRNTYMIYCKRLFCISLKKNINFVLLKQNRFKSYSYCCDYEFFIHELAKRKFLSAQYLPKSL